MIGTENVTPSAAAAATASPIQVLTVLSVTSQIRAFSPAGVPVTPLHGDFENSLDEREQVEGENTQPEHGKPEKGPRAGQSNDRPVQRPRSMVELRGKPFNMNRRMYGGVRGWRDWLLPPTQCHFSMICSISVTIRLCKFEDLKVSNMSKFVVYTFPLHTPLVTTYKYRHRKPLVL